ncbi:hypothetical protein, partial [Pseudomonas sp. NFACC04-2]|uniref:hypothetical protein n=1 Tax=Pseudomonas sp. NFACC04-2 TaxID=1566242 RepID=UPI003530EF7C
MKKLTPNPPKTTANPRWLSSSVTQEYLLPNIRISSLLAIAVGQLMPMLDVMPSSRASSLPQFFPSCS